MTCFPPKHLSDVVQSTGNLSKQKRSVKPVQRYGIMTKKLSELWSNIRHYL